MKAPCRIRACTTSEMPSAAAPANASSTSQRVRGTSPHTSRPLVSIFERRASVLTCAGSRMTRLCSAHARSTAWRIQNVAYLRVRAFGALLARARRLGARRGEARGALGRGRARREAEAALGVEALHGPREAEGALLQQVLAVEAAPPVALRDGDHQPQVRLRQRRARREAAPGGGSG